MAAPYSTGAGRGSSRAYRWTFDGTHIHGADEKTVLPKRAYGT
ncbi:hypothetical protein ACFTWH_17065 [Streptomyces sp. NPDC057011]